MAQRSAEAPLNERAQHLLRALVHRYIRDGQPVGSRALTRDAGLDLSAASIRNVMADLEDAGYVQSPHTSAGRIPTDRGYRFFVDSLLKVRSSHGLDAESLRIRLDGGQDTDSLVDSASNLLSGLTHLAGVVMLPKHLHRAPLLAQLGQRRAIGARGHHVTAPITAAKQACIAFDHGPVGHGDLFTQSAELVFQPPVFLHLAHPFLIPMVQTHGIAANKGWNACANIAPTTP
jgi:hypothetical protein